MSQKMLYVGQNFLEILKKYNIDRTVCFYVIFDKRQYGSPCIALESNFSKGAAKTNRI